MTARKTTRKTNNVVHAWLIAAISLIAACASQTAQPIDTPVTSVEPTATTEAVTTPTAVPTGALIAAAPGGLARTLHPYPDSTAYTQAWLDAAALIWGGLDGGGALLAFDWDALDYRPAMAAQMPQVSTDWLTYTFTLRDDLKWSDGSPITPDDFTFAFDQASRDENRYVQLDLLQEIASVQATSPTTVAVTLKDARPRDLALAVVNAVRPVPRHVWNGRPWNDSVANPEILNPSVVLGPLKPASFSADSATFVPVDTYYAGTPQVPQVTLLAGQDPLSAYALLKNAAANWLHGLPSNEYGEAKLNPNLQVVEWTAANAAYRTLEFNLSRPFLADRRVRQALAVAVDRSELIRTAEQGLAEPQFSFIQPTNRRWVNTTLDRYDYDPSRARQLLVDAGYHKVDNRLVGRDGRQVTLQVVFPTSSQPRASIAAYLERAYADLGILVNLNALDFDAYADAVESRRDFDIALASYAGGALDPDLGTKAQLITSGQQNVTGYSSPQVDDLFRQAAGELDQTRRKQLYDRVQALVNADVPSHYLYAIKSVDAFARTVHGVTPHSADRLDVNDAILSWTVDQ
jgi:peptide/nickel transport system substrate-binding protein